MAVTSHLFIITTLFALWVSSTIANKHHLGVTYDGRSLIINGRRKLLFSGSVHYTRSTPDMWPELIEKAKRGSLNVIDTYIFWNIHEPVQGQYNFEGQYDVVKFIKMIGEHNMYAIIRIGPYIEAEWKLGGFPYWLREVKNITFRTYNPPFKHYMQKFVTMIVEKLKSEKLFASQGGPIILSQIENEYKNVEPAFGPAGARYVRWAAQTAVGLNTGVPWIMCKQADAPDPVINTCNGKQCYDTFIGPNKPYKPALWTENWTTRYKVFGDPPSQRSVEDIAFSVARWFSKKGTLVNYYMYHGGTNFGRTSSSFVQTAYYDEAPLDEYGLEREPKWGHLRELHKAIWLCKRALLWGELSVARLGRDVEAHIFEKPGMNICAAFLSNNHSRIPRIAYFRGGEYYLPPNSVSILPDCMTVVHNTMAIMSQHNSRNFLKSTVANHNLQWEMYREVIPSGLQATSGNPLDLFGLTKDTTDYAWYTTRVYLTQHDLLMQRDIAPVLQVKSLGHAMLMFINSEYVGSAHGSKVQKSFVLQKPVRLITGINNITLLGSLVGLPDSGAYLERRLAGPRGVLLMGLNSGTLDLTFNGWGHQTSLDGEKVPVYTLEGSQKVTWTRVDKPVQGPALTWYKTYFDAPEGNNPVVVRMTGMGKGVIWINGNNIGRYWMNYLSPILQPSQSLYHIPRAYLKPTDNLMVILEEAEVSPVNIEILVVNRDTICSYIMEDHLLAIKSRRRQDKKTQPSGKNAKPLAHLTCPSYKKVTAVEFASYGNPTGSCGGYTLGNCSSSIGRQVVEQHCLGKSSCDIPIEKEVLNDGNEACQNIKKTLAIQVKCS